VKLRVLSDLHLEACDWAPPDVATDVIILAGDIHHGAAGIAWARQHFKSLPVIYVPGNHELFDGQLQNVLDQLRETALRYDVHFLDSDETVIDGVRFLGATLWSDFALYGNADSLINNSMAHAQAHMIDYQRIGFADGIPFSPEHSRVIHRAQVQWLERTLHVEFPGSTVVVTHFLPHRASIHPRYAGEPSNPFFASDLDRLVRPPVTPWIHGHTHESIDVMKNGTRIICNPRGSLPDAPNQAFNDRLVVDLSETN
jgi:predicted phosphodiesterase